MKRAINFVTLLILAACAAPVPLNSYGLRVVPDAATYERVTPAEMRLVDLSPLGIPLDIRYATPDNFMKQILYPVAKAYLRAPAARALAEVDRELAQRGLGIKVFDAYRPYRVTVAMWEPIMNPDYVADPAKGSRHNRGAAVDLTLIDRTTGAELPMPTPYDDFTSRAAHEFTDLPADVVANRALLREVMERHGFEALPSEWWHYDFKGWREYELMDIPLEHLSSGVSSDLSQNLVTSEIDPTL
ncbi:MAG TPA: M15 family metallopeptidase [Thermoanaerobaculia bacterium]|nr:M15 family metallopeptidase [Thermoanaerobaculia bacterium]